MISIDDILLILFSALAGGLVTLVLERIRTKKEIKITRTNKIEQQRKDRPELIVTNMEDYFDYPGLVDNVKPSDIDIFVALIKSAKYSDGSLLVEYDAGIRDRKTWVFRQYELKNVGNTTIYETTIASNDKHHICVFNTGIFDDEFPMDSILNYYELFDRRIAPNEKFSLRIFYNKDAIISGFVSAVFEFFMKDDNGVYWAQPFFAPDTKTYESRRISSEEYRESILSDKAEECFREPFLW